MAGLLLPLILLVGGYIWYTKFNGRETIDGIFNEIKGIGGGGSDFSFRGGGAEVDVKLPQGMNDLLEKAKSRTGSWTDERGNRFNNQSDSNSQSNIGGSGSIVQKQSNVFYTIPRFGNL
jgi:hypothetical protein